MDKTTLSMLAACAGFGLTAALLVVWIARSIRQAALQQRSAAPPSARRAALRQQARDKSAIFAIILPAIEALAPIFRRKRYAPLRAYASEPYIKSGSPGGLDEAELTVLCLIVGLALAGLISFSLAVMMGPVGLVLGVIGVPFGFMAVVASLKTKADVRQKQISSALPYALDLMVLVLRAGTSVGIALERVAQDYSHHPIGEEFGQVLAEMQMGANRRDAFMRMAQRVELDDIQVLVDNILQAEELGWALADTLERLSDRLNTQRMLQAKESAGTAGVLIMLPSTLILASVIVLLFGPLIVKYMRGTMSLS